MGQFLAAANVSISASSSRYPLTAQGSVISGNKTWCAEFDDELQYLEIDLKQSSYVMEIVTQGAVDEDSWVENYTISFSDNGVSWIPYKENSTLKVKCTISGKKTNKREKQQQHQENKQTKAAQHFKNHRNKQCDQILSIVIQHNFLKCDDVQTKTVKSRVHTTLPLLTFFTAREKPCQRPTVSETKGCPFPGTPDAPR